MSIFSVSNTEVRSCFSLSLSAFIFDKFSTNPESPFTFSGPGSFSLVTSPYLLKLI